jgi:hypothetical protein
MSKFLILPEQNFIQSITWKKMSREQAPPELPKMYETQIYRKEMLRKT